MRREGEREEARREKGGRRHEEGRERGRRVGM